jgi:hypothetical protein
VLSLNVEDLDLENHVEWLHLQAGSARLLARLIAGRSRGPLFLSDRRPAPARAPAAADLSRSLARCASDAPPPRRHLAATSPPPRRRREPRASRVDRGD